MFVIKSRDQRQKTLKRIADLKEQIAQLQQARGSKQAESFTASVQTHLHELEEQVREYDRLRKYGPGAFRPRHLAEVGPYLLRARIAAGITQTQLAEHLEVSQPMVYKYEATEYQGVRLDVLSKVAKALGVSVDIEAVSTQPKKMEYRAARQEAAMLYFLQQINNKFLGKTKLMKLLYYADYEWIRNRGISITGDSYVALPYGPTPKHGQEALRRLANRGAIRIEKAKLGDYDQERYLALQDLNDSVFTREEGDHLAEVARRFEHWTAKQMSDLSHEEFPWQSTTLGEEIGFFTAE